MRLRNPGTYTPGARWERGVKCRGVRQNHTPCSSGILNHDRATNGPRNPAPLTSEELGHDAAFPIQRAQKVLDV